MNHSAGDLIHKIFVFFYLEVKKNHVYVDLLIFTLSSNNYYENDDNIIHNIDNFINNNHNQGDKNIKKSLHKYTTGDALRGVIYQTPLRWQASRWLCYRRATLEAIFPNLPWFAN